MNYYLLIPDPDVYDSLRTLSDTSSDILNNIKGQKINDLWTPIPVGLVKMKHRGDFSSMSGLVTFNDKAWQILQPLIKHSVEALPLDCKVGIYYVINVLEKASLDLEKADIDKLPSGKIIRINKYAFKNETVIGKHIFTLKEKMYSKPIISETFKEIVEKNELKGLIFKKVWELGDYNI